MKEQDENMVKLNFILEEAEKRPLTKDEIMAIYNITRDRIKKIKKKALKRLAESKEKKKNKKGNSAGSDKVKD
jgi:DNA-directed RNA polymerase sigma subunit (sigma70/sigma32)